MVVEEGVPALAIALADHRVQAVPDGGKLMALPPVVGWAPTAVPMAQDVSLDVECWGQVWGEGESKKNG